ncbi:hypothetical protein [Planococcus sp. MB-3u-03]|uniref:hypothetical protein n=1 Tax=Planococcus sp. MB-3u-03 TaxID=2058136 RepID=UPI002FCD8775
MFLLLAIDSSRRAVRILTMAYSHAEKNAAEPIKAAIAAIRKRYVQMTPLRRSC